MSSDSELSSNHHDVPAETILVSALKTAVQRVFKSGKLDNLTVKRIRELVEKDLKLENGFFKNDDTWKDKSKQIIGDEAVSKFRDFVIDMHRLMRQ
jgi:hypothetical protein